MIWWTKPVRMSHRWTGVLLAVAVASIDGACMGAPERVMDAGGRRYPTARIGSHVWMTKNLQLDVGGGSFCYDDDPTLCDTMGRIYTWDAATRAAAQIPGWHLPSKEEWLDLIATAGPDSLAYDVIVSEEFGFNPQWSGVWVASSRQFRAAMLQTVNYWSSTASEEDSSLTWSVAIMSNRHIISPHHYPQVNACSVRLVKDE